MNTPDISHTIETLGRGEVLPRRSLLQLGVGGLALGTAMSREDDSGEKVDQSHVGDRRKTERIVRRLLRAFESRDTAAIWSFFAHDGVFEFPFVGLRVSDFASFDEMVGPALAALEGLTFTDLVFEPLADPESLIVTHNGSATVSFTGKPFSEMYVNVAHLRRGKVTSFAVYYDTAMFNEAFTP
jgi:ketosteroid isomerase-like protein